MGERREMRMVAVEVKDQQCLTPLISYPVFSESAVLAVVAENQSNI